MAPVVESIVPTTTGKPAEFETCPVAIWHLSGSGDLPGHLSKVPESERGESEVVGQLSFLHETVCYLCWPALPGFEYSSRSRRAACGLEDGQTLGYAVYEGAALRFGAPGPQVIGIDVLMIRADLLFKRLLRPPLLIVDDFGLQKLTFPHFPAWLGYRFAESTFPQRRRRSF